MPDEKLPIPQFAAKIKAKYPEYKDVNDTLLVQKIVAKYPEYRESVDLSGIEEPSKKKVSSLLSGVTSQAGNGLLNGGGGGVRKVEYPDTLPENEWDRKRAEREKYFSDTINQEELQKDPLKTLNKAIFSEAIGKEINKRPVSESTGQKYLSPEIKVNEENINVHNQARLQDNLKANIFPTTQSARERLFSEGRNGAADPNNETDLLAEDVIREHEKVKAILNLHKGDIKNAAIEYYANQDPRVAEIFKAGGTPPPETVGALVGNFLRDKNVFELSQESEEVNNAYREAQFNFRKDYPEMFTNEIVQKIAQGREDYGENNPFINLVGVNSSDRVMQKLYADGKVDDEEMEHYEKMVRPMLALHLKRIPTTGLAENAFQSAEKAAADIPKGLYDLTGIHNAITTRADRAYDELSEEANYTHVTPKTFGGTIATATGHLGGLLLPLSAGTKALAASKIMNAKTANETMMLLTFYHDLYKDAEKNNPNGGYLNQIQALVQSTIFAKINPTFGALSKGIVTKAAPQIKEVLEKLKTGAITGNQAKEGMVQAILTQVPKKTLKTSGEMMLATGVSDAVGGIFSGKYDGEQSVSNMVHTFESMLLGTPLLNLASVRSNRRVMEEYLNDMGDNPTRYREQITKLAETDPEIKKRLPELLQNLTHVEAVKKELDAREDIKPSEKKKYLLLSLQEKLLKEKADAIPDEGLKPEKQLKEIEIEKKMALDPDMGNQKIVEEFYNIEGLLPKGISERLEVDGKFSPAKVGGILKEIAQQANNLDENWKPIAGEVKMTKPNVPDQLIEIANERWAKEIEAAKPKEEPIPDLNFDPETNQATSEAKAEQPSTGLRRGDVEGKEKKETAQSRAKKVYKDIGEIDEPTDARGLALEYLAGGNKVHESVVDEVANRVKKASLNTGAKEKKSAEVKARDYTSKDAPTIDEIVHSIWDNLSEEVQSRVDIQDLKNELMDVVGSHNTRLSAATEFRDRYIAKDVMGNLSEAEAKEMNDLAIAKRTKIVQELPESQQTELLQLIEKYEDKYGNVDWAKLEKDSNGFDPDILSLSTETQQSLDAIIQKNISEAASESRNTPDKDGIGQEKGGEKTVDETIASTDKGNKPKPPKEKAQSETGATEAGEGTIPPKEPGGADAGKDGEGGLNDKGVLNRLYNAKGTPKEAKEGFKEKGLKYVPAGREEAAAVAKTVVDEFGIDEAVLLAEANKFKGGVNSAIFAESLNRLYEQEIAAKTPQEKAEIAKKFAEVGIRYDEVSREKGRDISQIDFFYKKSPLGVEMIEKAKRAEAFEEWAKPKDKSWKEVFDEMMKNEEFEKEVNERVKEELRKERAETRKARKEKVDKFFDDAVEKTKGGATYGTIIPPPVIRAAIRGMQKAYHAGEKVVELVEEAVAYISDKLGTDSWDKDRFRKEWAEKLKDKQEKKPLTDAELKTKILDKFRKKLKGLSDAERDEVIRKSFKKIVESGGLDYQDFRDIIGEVTGRKSLTEAEAAKLRELVNITNSVKDAETRVLTERTEAALLDFRKAELQAGKAAKELSELLYNKPDIVKRLTSIMQLSTLGIPSLINNPIYNIWNQATLRFPVGVINDVVDRVVGGMAKLVGKNYVREYNVFETQKEFWNKLGLGTKESMTQLFTGLNRQDYTQKELYGQQIRPFKSMRDLLEWSQGKKKLNQRQVWDKAIQATVGVPAEAVARVLNIGDKPMRFSAEGAQASAFAKALGLKGMDYKLFVEFPREEAYRAYKAQGLSDAEAAQKADYVKEAVVKEGQRSTFQQDNLLNEGLTRLFSILGGKESGTATLTKTLTISPYVKIPSNAFWSYYNLLNPEIAILQAMAHGGRAKHFSNKGEFTKSKLASREARYWMAHAIVGMASRAVVIALVKQGVFTPGSDEDDSKKERDAVSYFDKPGTTQVGDMKISNRWFGQWGMLGNAMAKKYRDATPEQREKQDDFWNTIFGGMEVDGLKEMQNGIFANSSAILQAIDSGNPDRYLTNTLNMMANIVQPAAIAQYNRASLDEVPSSRGDNLLDKLNQNFAQRSPLYRKLTGTQIDKKRDIWGQTIPRGGNVLSRMFGISKANPQIFARPIYDDYLKTGDSGFLPPAVLPVLDGQKLKTKQYETLQEYIGAERKKLVEPYVNDMAVVEGFDSLYSQMKDEDKKYVLQYLYNKGRDKAVEKFYQDFPELKKEEEKDEVTEEQRGDFRKQQKANDW